MNKIVSYILSIIVIYLVATIPQKYMKSKDSSWYKCVKSSITPPNYVFPIVWTFLYILLTIFLAEILATTSIPQPKKTYILGIFIAHLLLSMYWSFLFFGEKKLTLALIVLVILVLSAWYVYRCVAKQLPQNKGWISKLLIPYIAWISFATLLNAFSAMNEHKC